MLHEHRVYTCLPGRLPRLLARMENPVLSIWDRLGFRPVGFWTTAIGPSNNDLTYLLSWSSLSEREDRWSRFRDDPEWLEARRASEADGPIVANIASTILAPTRFSPPA
jgi:hypothetical protein